MSSLQSLTVAQLHQVISIKEKIEALEAELAAITGGEAAAPAVTSARRGRPPGRRGMSAAGRARIAAAQKARWAKVRGAVPAVIGKRRRHMSAAARARITAAQKRRWAKVKMAEHGGGPGH